MRVALPAWRLFTPRTGVGACLWHLLDHYRALAPNDEFVVLHDGAPPELPVAPNIVARRVRAPLVENNLTWHELALPLAIRRARVDLVHNIAYTLPWAVRGPSVVTVHDVSYVRHPEWFPAKAGAYLRWGTALAARRARVLVADTEFGARELAQVYGLRAERLAVVPLGVEPAYSPAADAERVRRAYDLPARFVLYLGGIHTRRRADLLVAACARVLPSRDAHLVVAGPAAGGCCDLGAQAARLGLAPRVRLLGYVPEADKPGLYRAAACFAWPSVYEGFGLPPLEAMACGTPTIVARATSLPEVVGDGALLVAPDDEAALADALARLLDEPATARELAARGLARAAGFSWRAAAKRMLAIYARVVA